MGKIILAVMALLLTACSSDPDSFWVSPRVKAEHRAVMAQKAADDQDAARCIAYGFAPGTGGFAGCRLELHKARMAATTTVINSSPPAPPVVSGPAPAPWPPLNTGVRCTTTPTGGGYSTTSCY